MPLSDQEQRILDELERGFTKRSRPKRALALRNARVVAGSWTAWSLTFLAGLALLTDGLRTANKLGPLAGVAGYTLLVIFTHHVVTYSIRARRRRNADRKRSGEDSTSN